MSDNSKGGGKSTNSRRSSPKNERSAPDSWRSDVKVEIRERSPLACAKYTSHRFKDYRRVRGALIRQMREKRGLSQSDLGAPSQVRLYESGEATQIGTLEILARIVPCPREMIKYMMAILDNLPVACTSCRAACEHMGKNEKTLLDSLTNEITMDLFE
jgi:DNA-binding transcriptional regulator YiaG